MPVEFWIAPFVALALTQIAALATSVYLHRTLAHRALAFHPLADTLFRAVLWLTTGQDRRQWVAVHRKHHAFTDRDGDPHSPRLLGFWRVQLLNVYYYAREARNPATLATFAPDITPDRLDRALFSRGWLGSRSASPASACYSARGPACSRPASTPCSTCSCSRRSSTVSGTGAARRTSRTRPTTRARWRGSRAARAFTTTTTRTPARRSSACAAGSSIRPGR
jgi:hypothetical protein